MSAIFEEKVVLSINNVKEKPVCYIKNIGLHEVEKVIEFAKNEGWNPGLFDANAYYSLDPEGFLALWFKKEMIGVISTVCYFNSGTPYFAYIGLFIIKKIYRNQGYGTLLWTKAIEKLIGRIGNKIIYLYAVPGQELRYKKMGFISSSCNTRLTLAVKSRYETYPFIINHKKGLFKKMVAYDKLMWGASRGSFFKEALKNTGSKAAVVISRRKGEVKGYGMIRRCIVGFRIGPVFAKNFKVLKVVLNYLISTIPLGSTAILDTPRQKDAPIITNMMTYFGFQEDKSMRTISMFKGVENDLSFEKRARFVALSSLEVG